MNALNTISHFPIHSKSWGLQATECILSFKWWTVLWEIFKSNELLILSCKYSGITLRFCPLLESKIDEQNPTSLFGVPSIYKTINWSLFSVLLKFLNFYQNIDGSKLV